MKIAVIVGKFPVLSETFILNQITQLIDFGHDVTILARWQSSESTVHSKVVTYSLLDRCRYFVPNKKSFLFFKVAFGFIKLLVKRGLKAFWIFDRNRYHNAVTDLRLLHLYSALQAEHFDIVHSHFGMIGFYGAFLKDIGITKAFAVSFHGKDINVYPKKHGKNVYRYIFNRADLVMANTQYTAHRLEIHGCDPEKIKILPMGLPMEDFQIRSDDSKWTKLKDGVTQILTVARLVEKKGHFYAIEAVAQLIRLGYDLSYTIAGGGPVRENLEQLCRKLGIESKVRFLGPVDFNRVLSLYSEAHIFLLPSITAGDGDEEGQGLVLQEAQLCRLPVVSTRHNGIPEGVIEGETALLAEEKDVKGLVDAIRFLIDNPGKAREMGEKGSYWVKERYDQKELVMRLASWFQTILEQE